MSQPLPGIPTSWFFGTFTSVKKVSQKGEEPEISRIGRVSTPDERAYLERGELIHTRRPPR